MGTAHIPGYLFVSGNTQPCLCMVTIAGLYVVNEMEGIFFQMHKATLHLDLVIAP